MPDNKYTIKRLGQAYQAVNNFTHKIYMRFAGRPRVWMQMCGDHVKPVTNERGLIDTLESEVDAYVSQVIHFPATSDRPTAKVLPRQTVDYIRANRRGAGNRYE